MDCAEDECPEGYVCGDLSDGRYCLEACTDDEGCRDGTVCVLGQCRPPVPFGAECEDAQDCRSGVCYEETCNQDCGGAGRCPGELSCVDVSEGEPRCVEHTFPTGEGTFNSSCTFADCAEDFDCVARTEDPANDPTAYCTRSCLTDLDCSAEMSCRRSQLPGDDEVVFRCVPRLYCERCTHDSQCSPDRCVREDPDRGDGAYCSVECDPDRPRRTCPTDASCHEALYCSADHSWVADCQWCSDPETCASNTSGAVYQCFEDYGACSGSGDDYCSPCFVDEDCPEGGFCNHDAYADNSYCTAPCPVVDENYDCGDEHSCYGYQGLDEPICMPRSGSCSVPSGGLTTCDPCGDDGDCYSGYCLPLGSSQSCGEDCSQGLDDDCPPWTQCYSADYYGTVIQFCSAAEDFSCGQVRRCRDHCPEGPDSCDDDAPSYCSEWSR